jgi:ACS family tartrate transporter-like MFS transporter
MEGIGGLHGWQWLFLLEGLPASMLGFAVLKFLPDGPKDASWLTDSEKSTIVRRLDSERAREPEALWRALRNPTMLVLALAGFGSGCSLYATGLWLPQIVKGMGFSTLATGFVVALVYAFSMGAIVGWGYSSDRRGERFGHVALAWLFAASGFALASFAGSSLFGLLGLICAVAGTQSAIGPYFTTPSTFLSGAAVAGGIGAINTIVSLGGFVGPTLVGILSQQSGDYRSAMAMLCGLLILGAMTIMGVGRAMSARRTITREA